jgi:hypothetical protein
MSNAPYILPKICCRCGENNAYQTRAVITSHVEITGYYVAAMTTKQTGFSFEVPICDDCCEKLDRSDWITKATRLFFSALLSLGFLYWFTVSGYLFVGLLISIMAYVVMHLMYKNKPITRRSLGGFTGRYLYFSNVKFFKEFALLNPGLVSPQDLNMLVPEQNKTESVPKKKEPLEFKTRLLLIFAFGAALFFFGCLILAFINL